MYSLKKGSKIIIMGTDKSAIVAYYKYRKNFEVLGILDNTIKEDMYRKNIRIFSPNILHNLNGAIVVICKANDLLSAKWFEIFL